MRVLLIGDNDHLAANIGEYLETCGDYVDYAYDGRTGLNLIHSQSIDVIVLDVALPRISGLQIARHLRDVDGADIPILMLTARDSLADKLAGFDAGADDYLTKPFELLELRARLAALVKRRLRPGVTLVWNDLSLNTLSREVCRGARQLNLTPIRFRLLEALLRRAPHTVSHRELADSLWHNLPPSSDGALRVHIHALRMAVDSTSEQKLIQTIPGIGYRIGDESS